MSIFAPQNVMGPAHRGNVLQQLAQGAAQNVLRRQKLKALLQNTAGQAGAAHAGGGIGAGVPFRGSTMGHATGVRGATIRPGAPGGFQARGAMGAMAGGAASGPQFADPGAPDLASLPDAADPSQSASSTAPGQQINPAAQVPVPPFPGGSQGGSFSAARLGTQPGPVSGPGAPGQINSSMTGTGTSAADATPIGIVNTPGGQFQQQQLIPLGGGMFYDPVTDAIHGGGR